MEQGRVLGSPPHDTLPLAIGGKISVGIRELVRVKAGSFVLNTFVPRTLAEEVAGLIKGLGLAASVGLDAAGAPVAVRLRLGGCDPEVLLQLEQAGGGGK